MQEILRENKVLANRYACRCLGIFAGVAVLALLLDAVGIFSVDLRLMQAACLLSAIIFILPELLNQFVPENLDFIRLCVISCGIAGTFLMACLLPKHMVLAWVIPLLLCCHYYSRRLIIITLLCTIVMMAASIFIGMFVGEWDTNLLGITSAVAVMLKNPGLSYDQCAAMASAAEQDIAYRFFAIETTGGLCGSRLVSVAVFYVAVRSLILCAVMPICTTLTQRSIGLIERQSQIEREKQEMAIVNDMIQMQNLLFDIWNKPENLQAALEIVARIQQPERMLIFEFQGDTTQVATTFKWSAPDAPDSDAWYTQTADFGALYPGWVEKFRAGESVVLTHDGIEAMKDTMPLGYDELHRAGITGLADVPIIFSDGTLYGVVCIDNPRKMLAYDRMLDFIRTAFSTAFESLRSERERADRMAELARARDRAERAAQAESAFLANMSHEIRTPINAVLGMDQMILRELDSGASDPAVLTQYAVNIENAGRNLLSIINDILDMSKIESGKMDINPVEYEIASVLNDLVNMITPRVREKGLMLHLAIAEDIPRRLLGDDMRLQQIITNILTNAVKYTPAGAVTLRVAAKQAQGGVLLHVAVQDTGVGIRPEDRENLFAKFKRLDQEKNRNIEGTGLGMSITTNFLKMMGSTLQVDSVYGVGSTFWFDLFQEVVDPAPMGDFKAMYEQSLQKRQAYRRSFTAPAAHILVVDDNAMNLTVAAGLLKPLQMRLDTASSGQQALALLQADPSYDLVFMDHMMPVMDGLETTARIRALPGAYYQKLPVIALTANAVAGAREKFIAAGMQDFVSKPIEAKKIERCLHHWLPAEKVVPEEETPEKTPPADEPLPLIPGLDTAYGVTLAGSKEVYCAAVRDYYAAMAEKDALVRRLMDARDLKEYTVQVHGLKSAARFIGNAALGDQFARLEKCGNAGDWDEILAATPAVLADYMSWRQPLGDFCAAHQGMDSRPDVDPTYLAEILSAVEECLCADDPASAASIAEELEGFALGAAGDEQLKLLLRALRLHNAAEARALCAQLRPAGADAENS